jgi:hypothetical protein
MKAVISLAALLGCALSLDAQITAALNRLPDGSIEIRVRNDSAVSSTAFAIKVDHVTGSAMAGTRHVYLDPDTVYVDTAIDTALRALQPNQEHTFKPRLRSRSGGPAPLVQILSDERKQMPKQVDLSEHTVTTAGVFADGSTTGDAALLARLMLRRSNMLLAVETTLETLSDAGRRNVNRDQLIGQFKKLADSVRHGYLPLEQRIGLDLYQSIIGKLMNLPETKDGSPFPPNEFVLQETTRLRQQRIPLLESQPSLFSVADASRLTSK